jgi:hypothetical protein
VLNSLKRHLPGRKYISGSDTFIRHRYAAALIRKYTPETVLDVGGEGFLRHFVGNVRVTSANIKEGADVQYVGDSLPFGDGSFDLVVSIDTLEHLPKGFRTHFCKELLRVARKGIVVCAPLGTPEHVAYEKELLASGRLWDETLVYLEEHVKYGIPTPDEVTDLSELCTGELFYQGDFRKVRRVGRALAYPYLALQILSNIATDVLWMDSGHLDRESHPYTNRFFMAAYKPTAR